MIPPTTARETSVEIVHPRGGQHFCPDEHDRKREAFVKILKVLQGSGQQEIERAQAENRANIGAVNDERIARDAEHGGYGVHGQHHVRRFQDDDHQKKRSEQPLPFSRKKSLVPETFFRNGKIFLRPSQQRIVFGMHGVVGAKQFES